MRKTPEDFDGRELELVYIAKKLKDALGLETLLTERGIDYVVGARPLCWRHSFSHGAIWGRFYVEPEAKEAAGQKRSRIGIGRRSSRYQVLAGLLEGGAG